LPDLQKAGGLEMGENSFAFNSLTDRNFLNNSFTDELTFQLCTRPEKIQESTSKNKSTGREKLVLIARFKN
jgi:hypothetical protein